MTRSASWVSKNATAVPTVPSHAPASMVDQKVRQPLPGDVAGAAGGCCRDDDARVVR